MGKTYYDLLNDFYDLLEKKHVSGNAQLLYYTLLQINNRSGWTEWFYRTNISICGLIRISEKALTNAKNELKQLELIDFISSKKRGDCTRYSILNLTKDSTKEVQRKYKRSTEEVQKADINKDKDKDKDKTSSSSALATVVKLSNLKSEEEEKILKVLETYKANINSLPSPIEVEYIRDWLNEVEPDVIILAVETAVLNNGRSLHYIKRVIDNWICQGLTTGEQVKAYLENWERNRNGAKDTKLKVICGNKQDEQQAEFLAKIESRKKRLMLNDDATM